MNCHKLKVVTFIFLLSYLATVTLTACQAKNNAAQEQVTDISQKTIFDQQSKEDTGSSISPSAISDGMEQVSTKNVNTKQAIDEMSAQELVQKFCDDMAISWLNLERVDMSEYVMDNLDTHLALKWIDFDIADRKKNSWKQLKSIDSIVLSNGKFQETKEYRATYETFADIKYTRYETSVNGIGIDLTITLEMNDNKLMISGINLVGPSIYSNWKKENYQSIEEMDKAFLNSCKEFKIQ
jgi:hypothetical protein